MVEKGKPKEKPSPEKGGVSNPATKPALEHPRKPGDPITPSGPAFEQSVEQGGMD